MVDKLIINLFFFSFIIAQDFRKNYWEKTDYIWNFGIISACNVGLIKNPIKFFEKDFDFNFKFYKNIKKNDLVWVKCCFIKEFYNFVLPNIKDPFILIVSDGDESFPSESGLNRMELEALLNNNNIIHIFAQNCDYIGKSKKISHIPIGVDFHTIGYKSAYGGWGEKGSAQEQEVSLKYLLSTLKPTKDRIQKAFVDFQCNDTMHGERKRYLQFGEDRKSIFKKLLATGLIDYGPKMKRSDLWKTKGQYAFSISPCGNGLDCHRTWEDLILGCIVIVKTSPLDPLYKGLPVVIVKDWSEFNQANIDIWIEKYGDALNNPNYRKRLTNKYWLNKIYSKLQ